MATNTFRTTYRELAADEKADMEAVKVKAEEIEAIIQKRQGRQSALALTNLEQAVMWAVKQITG
jgi:hypothetical protein